MECRGLAGEASWAEHFCNVGPGGAVPAYAINLQQLIKALVDGDGLQVHVLLKLLIEVESKLSIGCAALWSIGNVEVLGSGGAAASRL